MIMLNARKYDERITIGRVPNAEDLRQLAQFGYKAVIDLRVDTEMFGGLVASRAHACELKYVRIPIRRNAIATDDLELFYTTVFADAPAPMYVFSRSGKKPLALLLLLDAVARGETFEQLAMKASVFGSELAGDLCLRKFLTEAIRLGDLGPVLPFVKRYRPSLVEERMPSDADRTE